MTLDYRVFCALMLTAWLYLSHSSVMRQVGIAAMIAIFLCGLASLLASPFRYIRIWLSFTIFAGYIGVTMVRTPTWQSLYTGALQIALLLLPCALSLESLSERAMTGIFRFGKISLYLLLAPAIIIIVSGGQSALRMFDSHYSFTIYKILFPCSYFFVAGSRVVLPKLVALSTVFFAMGERTLVLCTYVVYLTYVVLGVSKGARRFHRLLFVTLCGLVVCIPFMYMAVQYSPVGIWLNEISFQYTGANFYSGRDVIWQVALSHIGNAPLFGYGTGNDILAASGITWSTHNVYVYFLLQGGGVGLALFLWFMYSIWTSYLPLMGDSIVRMSAAYLVATLVMGCFELILVGNVVNISLYLWLVVAVGLIRGNSVTQTSDVS